MEIKINDYVRTKSGIITKLEEIDKEYYWFDKTIRYGYSEPIDYLSEDKLEETIVNHSPNIIDLIEAGDYVNGNIVYDVIDDEIQLLSGKIRKKRIHMITGLLIDEDEIKSIVTKEMIESIKYEVK